MAYKYWAFISYSHRDKAWGKWLHRKLDTYWVPRALRGRASRDGKVPARLYPIFRDREELPSSATLGDNIDNALRDSRYLIVICSPRAAASRWVNKEIARFKSLGREDRVLALIIDGEPNATDKPESGALECFPPALRYGVDAEGELIPEQDAEPIAADARPGGDGKRNAKLKLIAGLIGVNFDDLARREWWRVFWSRARYGTLAVVVLGAGVWWLVQPGFAAISLKPNPPPPGLGLTIDRRDYAFDPSGKTELTLSAGTHRFEFTAPNYESNVTFLTLGRNEHRSQLVELAHETGTLTVEAGPDNAQIEVDGKPFGSSIEQQKFDTGEHVLRATLRGHYERAQQITVSKNQGTSAYLSLDPAEKAWIVSRSDVQGGFINMGDVDGDGVEDFLHNFITEVAVVSGATGELLREYPVSDGNTRPFGPADLGGPVGHVAFSSGTQNVIGPDGKPMTDVLCFSSNRDKPFPLWRWLGPAPSHENAAITPVGDQNGDGVSEVVVRTASNDFWLVDGATGKTLRAFKFGISEWASPPLARRCVTPKGDGLFFCGRLAAANPEFNGRYNTFHAGMVSLKDGSLAWQKDFPGMLGNCLYDVDGHASIAFVNETDWFVCDGATGNVKQGKLPRGDKTVDLLRFLFADGSDGRTEWIMPFRDGANEAPIVAAVRPDDGAVLWKRTDLDLVENQLYAGEAMAHTPDGGLLLRVENGLVCLDPVTGQTRWERTIGPGEAGTILTDSAGQSAIYLGEFESGVRCIGMDGQPLWGVSLGDEYAPVLVLTDANHKDRRRLILNHHNGGETLTCEIACVFAPEGSDWTRRAIPPTRYPGSSNPSPPRAAITGMSRRVFDITSAEREHPNLSCFDAETGVHLWTAHELFETAYRRFGDPNQMTNVAEAAPALGRWGGTDAVAAIGRSPQTIVLGLTTLFVYSAETGTKLAQIPIDPPGNMNSDSLLGDVDGDGQNDFVVARPSIFDNLGTNVSGDVVAVGGAQGKQIWRRELNFPCWLATAPLPGGKGTLILVTLRDGTLCALKGSDGTQVWKSAPGTADGRATVADVNGAPAVLVTSASGTVAELDPATGHVLKSASIARVTNASGPVTVAAGAAMVLVACGDAGVVAFDAGTLAEKWRGPQTESVSVPPLMVDVNGDGKLEVVACTDSGHVAILDLNGTLLSNELLPGGTTDMVPDGEMAFLPKGDERAAKLFVTGRDGILRSKTLLLAKP